ncbi:methyl-accepting chemotaxis protein [Aliarcobacter butzleri]|uniref:methyl-accepting chemotaxis protein n=1 Tax=Aliarcobacter butzleri TaxID=28197 RepID=UPI001EDB42D5|nr:methyl-accepting chemotaxis protein [Aliarcobacter butzleri]MCG3709498.1 methyl-accepting chemotaxis protein [Aliarcobacter butzleri]
MLKNFSTRVKLYLFPILFTLILIFIGFIYIHYNNKAESRANINGKVEILVQDVLKGRISVYQFLRNPNEQTAAKVRGDFNYLNSSVVELKSKLTVPKNIAICDEIISNQKKYLELFDTFANHRIQEFNQGIKDETDGIKKIISDMVKVGLILEENLLDIAKSAVELKNEANTTLHNILFIVSIVSMILFISISTILSNIIVKSINNLKFGLLSFFSYLNKESSDIKMLDSSSNDEFGEMSKVINENISKTQKGIEEDRRLIDETIAVLGEFEQGDLCQRLKIDVANPALMQLKKALNNMGENLEKNINSILDILEQYANYNYLNKIDKQGLKEHLLKLANGVNHLGDSITSMLVENKSNGMTLDESSTILLTNVDKLNISSNEAAASLEETAAALEEITSNIRNNTENIAKMSKFSNDITVASKQGEELANKTTTAMDEINTQVNLVTQAISVIDNIAFQTNILSLNAAVEAATAGEAGKGFAVVAQEVRNLANRSAEAAKEIKDIVEGATLKANEGKDIASRMIEGYKGLNNSIEQTINLISDVEMSSKEQLLGIEQINDAVNQLDQQTQQNAMIASQTHDIAVGTDEIAKLVVSNANQKEFEGKNEVKAKDVGIKKEVKEHIIASTHKKIIKPKSNISNKKEITSSLSNDEWESF